MCADARSYEIKLDLRSEVYEPMSLETVLALLASVALLVYLAYALLRPEKF